MLYQLFFCKINLCVKKCMCLSLCHYLVCNNITRFGYRNGTAIWHNSNLRVVFFEFYFSSLCRIALQSIRVVFLSCVVFFELCCIFVVFFVFFELCFRVFLCLSSCVFEFFLCISSCIFEFLQALFELWFNLTVLKCTWYFNIK